MKQQSGPEPNRFIGVDLAWAVDRRHSGVAVLEGGVEGAALTDVSSGMHSLEAIVGFIDERLCGNMVIAVDASLIVANEVGQRPCERQIGRAFGQYGASCHSSNRARPHFDSGERLVRSLAAYGFKHGLPLDGESLRPGRRLIEVYPHPAMLRLFGLARILQYKKGTVDERRAGLRRVQQYLRKLLTGGCGLLGSECLQTLLAIDPVGRRGQSLKQLEDLLDAVFCAYLAWHFWRWGAARNEVFGDLASGYIVVPRSCILRAGSRAASG